MVEIALSAKEHVDELEGQISALGGVNVEELQYELAAALEREENLNRNIETTNVVTATKVEELSSEIQSFQRLIDSRYEEVKRSESARIVLEDELVRVDMVTDKLKVELERANNIIAELKRDNQQLKDEKEQLKDERFILQATQKQQPEIDDVNVMIDKKRNVEITQRRSPKAQAPQSPTDSIYSGPHSKSPRVIEDKNRTPGFLSATSSHKAKSKDTLVSAQLIDSTTPLRVAGVWK